MKRASVFVLIYTLAALHTNAQELFVFTNPASNIPAKAVVAKLGVKTIHSYHHLRKEYRFSPEVQAGLTKNLMVSSCVSFSNMFFRDAIAFESARLYTKYRFYSNDGNHKHFRAAVFAQGSWSNNPLVYHELNLDGDNSGILAGIVTTQLLQKFAVSGAVSYLQQFEQVNSTQYFRGFSKKVLLYNLSFGYLLFPFKYKSYHQANLNLYCEFLSQKSTDINTAFIDIAPALQFIFHSSTRFNFGGRFQLAGNAYRMANQSLYLSFEHYFLNVFE